MYNGKCYNPCPGGSYSNITDKKCYTCNPNCLTCDMSATYCTSCETYMLLQNHQCVTLCDESYF